MMHVKSARNLFLRTLRSKSIYTAAVFVLLCAVGWSQSTTGSVTGIVTDTSGAVVPKAGITVTNVATEVVQHTVTNSSGTYVLPDLLPGRYQAEIRAKGFAVTKTVLVVPLNRAIRWDAALKPGSVSTTVTVTDAGAHVNTTNHQLAETIGAKEIEDLPSNGLTLFSVLTYLTNVDAYIGNDSNDVDYFHEQPNSLTIGGSVFGTTDYLQDGVTNVNMLSRTANYQPPIAAAQEVSVIRDGASANFESPNVVNVITKSGTNAFHGELYEYLRNDALDAIGEVKVKKPTLRYDVFGGNIGGPILHNRLFFFFAYQGFRDNSHGITDIVTPTAAERTGDFSAFLPSTVIYDPSTYNPTTGAISPFPDNKIPPSEITNFAKLVLAYFPLPTGPNITGGNYQTVDYDSNKYDSYLGRVDYTIGRHDRIYGAFMMSNPYTESETDFTEPTFNPENQQYSKNAYIEETHIFNPQLVNLAHVGYNRSNVFNTVEGAGTANYPAEFGLTAMESASPSQWLPPGISDSASGGYAGWNPSIQGAIQNIFQYSDELTLTHGRQTIYAGAELDRIQFDGNWLLANDGSFSFNGQFTSNHALKQSGGNSIADLELGLPATAEGAIGQTIGGFRQYNVMPYIEDDWRVSKKLTLNGGIRYDYYGAPADRNGRSNVYDITTNTNHPGTFRQTYNDWAPRLGFAYSLRPTTIIHGGWGIYYSGDQYNELQFLVSNPPNLLLEDYTYTAEEPTPVLDTLTSNPGGATALTERSLALHMPVPYVEERNLSIQQAIGSHTVVQVDYVGSNAYHNMRRINANQAYLPTDLEDPASLQARRPYQWVGDDLEAVNTGYAQYNGVEGTVNSNFGNETMLFANAVYSKSLDDASSEEDVPENLYNMREEYGLSSFNRKFVFNAGGVSLIPILGRHDTLIRTNNELLNEVFGGWKLSGVFTILSGESLSTNAANLSNTGAFAPERADQSCNPNDFPARSQKEWFNTACFSQPAVYTFGSEPRNNIIGPTINQTSMSMFKTFTFGGSRSVTLRADAFDPFNASWLGNPNLTLSSPSFGIAGVGGARIFQLNMNVAF